jgi:4-hydroxy-tetrahydrodipicolinate synthase
MRSTVAHALSSPKAFKLRGQMHLTLKAEDLRGVIGVPVTPMTKSGDIDTETLKANVSFAIENDFHSVCVGMHLGESLNLTHEERELIAEVAVDSANGKVPVLVHTSCPGTRETVELSKHSEDVGADGVVVIVPYHWHPDTNGIRSHFTSVSRAIDIGVVAYNYPERIGVSFPAKLVSELAQRLDNFIGLKEASLNMAYFADVCRETSGKDFSVFAGTEYLIPSMTLGGTGSMSVAMGIAPKMVMKLYDLCKKGEYVKARPLQYKISKLLGSLHALRYAPAVKAAMAIMGRSVGPSRSPNQPLNSGEERILRKVLNDLGIIGHEKHGW